MFSVSEENSKSMGLYYFHDQDRNGSFQWLFGSVPFSTHSPWNAHHISCAPLVSSACATQLGRGTSSPPPPTLHHTLHFRDFPITSHAHAHTYTLQFIAGPEHTTSRSKIQFSLSLTIVLENFNVTFILIMEAFQKSVRLSQRVWRLLFQVAHQRAEETQCK